MRQAQLTEPEYRVLAELEGGNELPLHAAMGISQAEFAQAKASLIGRKLIGPKLELLQRGYLVLQINQNERAIEKLKDLLAKEDLK